MADRPRIYCQECGMDYPVGAPHSHVAITQRIAVVLRLGRWSLEVWKRGEWT